MKMYNVRLRTGLNAKRSVWHASMPSTSLLHFNAAMQQFYIFCLYAQTTFTRQKKDWGS